MSHLVTANGFGKVPTSALAPTADIGRAFWDVWRGGYSITSSAVNSNFGGIVNQEPLQVF
jgi:hypothetical protein